MAVCSLWGRCVPSLELAGRLTGHGHGFGLGPSLLCGRHPKPAEKRKERKEETMPFGVNLMRSQVLFRAAQA